MSGLHPSSIAIIAIFCYAFLGPLAKKVGLTIPPFTFVAISTFMLTALAIVVAVIFERDQIVGAISQVSWGWMIAFTAINLAGYALYLVAMSRMPVAQYEMFGILMPIFGGVIAYFLLKEPIHPRYLLALAFMAVGLYIAVAPNLKGLK